MPRTHTERRRRLLTPAIPARSRCGSILARAAALASSGHDTALHLIPGHTHWFYEIGPELAADAWRWFEGVDDPS